MTDRADRRPARSDLENAQKLEHHIEVANRLVEEQRARIARYNEAGLPSKVAETLLSNFVDTLELLHWQRAVVIWSSQDGTIKAQSLQPSPSRRKAPELLLQSICDELKDFVPSGQTVSNEEFRTVVRLAMTKRSS